MSADIHGFVRKLYFFYQAGTRTPDASPRHPQAMRGVATSIPETYFWFAERKKLSKKNSVEKNDRKTNDRQNFWSIKNFDRKKIGRKKIRSKNKFRPIFSIKIFVDQNFFGNKKIRISLVSCLNLST